MYISFCTILTPLPALHDAPRSTPWCTPQPTSAHALRTGRNATHVTKRSVSLIFASFCTCTLPKQPKKQLHPHYFICRAHLRHMMTPGLFLCVSTLTTIFSSFLNHATHSMPWCTPHKQPKQRQRRCSLPGHRCSRPWAWQSLSGTSPWPRTRSGQGLACGLSVTW